MQFIKNNSVISWGIAIAALLILIFVMNSGGTGLSSVPANLQTASLLQAIGSPDYDFGTISMADGTVTTSFTVTNAGDEPLTVKRMFTSCMCTTGTLRHGSNAYGPYGMPGHGSGSIPSFEETILPGEQATVEVAFDPAAHGPAGVGNIARSIILETNGTPLTLGVAARVTP